MLYTGAMRTIRLASSEVDALRAEVRGSAQARHYHRMHAVLLVARGLSCRGAARLLGDSPRAVEYWVKKYNENKIKGLIESGRPGRPPRLSAARLAELRSAVSGPPPSGRPAWTGAALAELAARRWGVVIGARQAQRLLAGWRYAR